MSDSLNSDGNPDINFVDRKNVHDRHDDITSSFRALNPQNQGWKTYYEFEEVFDEFPDVVPESEREIPVVYNAKVAEQISYFQNRGRRSFGIWLARSGKYVPSMKKILQQKGMPTDLVYMSMIESGFNLKAASHKAAVGPWQFIKPTATRYGLRVDSWVDERMDPKKSTIAAANYMSDLYAMFRSWELAAAGYNCGEDRVQNAIDKYQINDFWQISEVTLPRETKNYVPRFMAAMIIAKEPEKYGFTGIQYHESSDYETVSVAPQKSLKDIAGVLGVSYTKLVDLNPALLHQATPPGGYYEINVPPGYQRVAVEKSKTIASLSNVNPDIASTGTLTYRVRRGDTLGGLSKRYNVSMSKIKKANGLRSSNIMVGQTLRIPGRHEKVEYTSPSNRTSTVKYTVRRGDTLGAIAARHRVSIGPIKRANGLKGSLIKTGQVLTIPGASGRYYDDREPTYTAEVLKYKVQKGDTLGGIAARYNVSTTTIRRANGIQGSKIVAGQTIKIPHIKGATTYASNASNTTKTKSTQTSKYKVRPGDTLSGIADKHGVRVSSIKSANNLRGSTIMSGQTLTIPGSSSANTASRSQSKPSRYKVKRGDTLGGVAEKHGVGITALRNANNIKGSKIMVGQTLVIPNGSYVASKSVSKPSKYKVKSGDTLGMIAQRHGVRLASLKSANNLNGSTIRAGQVLVIPDGNSSDSNGNNNVLSYSVKRGDSLWEIASKHNVSVSKIKKWNNLKSDNLSPGKKLVIYQ